MATVSYVRVSTLQQNTDRQDFEGFTIDKSFIDKASGKDRERPALTECINYLCDGDTLLVHSLDRLARSLLDLNQLVSELTENGVTVKFIKEGLTFTRDTSNPTSELMLNILGSIAQFERQLIRERQAEGIAKAKAKGVYRGRKPSLNLEQCSEITNKHELGVPVSRIAKDYKVSRPTVYKVLDGSLQKEIAEWSKKIKMNT